MTSHFCPFLCRLTGLVLVSLIGSSLAASPPPLTNGPGVTGGTEIQKFELTVLPNPRRLKIDIAKLANALASGKPQTAEREILNALGSPHAVRRWAYRASTPAEDLMATIDPFAPDVFLTRFVTTTYVSNEHKNAALAQLARDSRFLSVEDHSTPSAPNAITPFAAPSDQYFARNSADEAMYQWGPQAMHFPEAWDKVLGRAYVGLPDQGADVTHPDLVNGLRLHLSKNLRGTAKNDYYVENKKTDIYTGGHGTHVTGIIGARSSDSRLHPSPAGVSGGCPDCGVILSPYDNTAPGYGNVIMYLTDVGVQVINNSFGDHADTHIFPECNGTPTTLCVALDRAFQRGISIVAATGNDRSPTTIPKPAGYNGVIAVGGAKYDPYDVRGWSFWQDELAFAAEVWAPPFYQIVPQNEGSNYGIKSDSQLFVAPAQKILSTFMNGATWISVLPTAQKNEELGCLDGETVTQYTPLAGPPQSPGYGLCTGTSMAAPHVTSLVALMRSANPLLTNAQTYEGLRQSSSRVRANQDIDLKEGWGLPRADYAVDWALSLEGSNGSYRTLENNRFTPLFGVYSSQAWDHVYSSAPQQMTAAMTGTMRPAPHFWTAVNGSVSSDPQPVQLVHPGGTCSFVPPVSTNCPQASTLYVPYLLTPGAGAVSNPTGKEMQLAVRVADLYSSTNTSGKLLSSCNNPYPVKIGTTDYMRYSFAVGPTGGVTDVTCLTWISAPLPQSPVSALVSSFEEIPVSYNLPVGTSVNGYPAYPCYFQALLGAGGLFDNFPCNPPMAIGYVFSTHTKVNGVDLDPLIRVSWRCGDGTTDANMTIVCAANPNHVSHLYTTRVDEISSLEATGYKIDGIEGYVFPRDASGMPPGVVPLCRYYASARDDWILLVEAGGCRSSVSQNAATYLPNPASTGGRIGWTMPNPLPAATVPLSIKTQPANLYVTIKSSSTVTVVRDGESYQAPSNQQITVMAPPQVKDGSTFFFQSWSDSNRSTHSVTMTQPGLLTANFTPLVPKTLDFDANGTYDALTDGLLNLRYAFGFTGTDMTGGAIGPGALRTTDVSIVNYIQYLGTLLDVDGDGLTDDALTDGLLVIRYLFGITGSALTNNVIGPNSTRRSPADIVNYLNTLAP